MSYSLRNDKNNILLDREAEMPDSLLASSFFYQRNNKLRLPVCRDDTFPCRDSFFKPVDVKAECMFQTGIHIDDAVIRIFAKNITIFSDDNGILRILHDPDFP